MVSSDILEGIEVYKAITPNPERIPTTNYLKDIAKCVRKLWEEHGATLIGGVLKVRIRGSQVKVNADTGKNLGWIMPTKGLKNSTKPSHLKSVKND